MLEQLQARAIAWMVAYGASPTDAAEAITVKLGPPYRGRERVSLDIRGLDCGGVTVWEGRSWLTLDLFPTPGEVLDTMLVGITRQHRLRRVAPVAEQRDLFGVARD